MAPSRQLHYLVVVVDDKTHFLVGEPGEQVCIQNLHLADAYAPAARIAFHPSAQRLRDDLVPETDANEGYLPCRGLPNPLL